MKLETNSRMIGHTGEEVAANFLKQRGYTIVSRNFKTSFAEIDIIAKQSNILCFIEVKTRSNLYRGLPREAVTYTKQQKIITAAQLFLKQNSFHSFRIRFDVIEVLWTGSQWQPILIPDAFLTA